MLGGQHRAGCCARIRIFWIARIAALVIDAAGSGFVCGPLDRRSLVADADDYGAAGDTGGRLVGEECGLKNGRPGRAGIACGIDRLHAEFVAGARDQAGEQDRVLGGWFGVVLAEWGLGDYGAVGIELMVEKFAGCGFVGFPKHGDLLIGDSLRDRSSDNDRCNLIAHCCETPDRAFGAEAGLVGDYDLPVVGCSFFEVGEQDRIEVLNDGADSTKPLIGANADFVLEYVAGIGVLGFPV